MRFIVSILFLSIFCFAQNSGNHKVSTANSKILKLRLVIDQQTFDWTKASAQNDTIVLLNIMEGLFELDSKMQLKPRLAESYTLSSDQMTYTVKLKPNVKWSDGKRLEATDFIDAWQRLLDPLTSAPYANLLIPHVEGAKEYHLQKEPDFSKVGVKALDPLTLQIKLKHPASYFLQLLSLWPTFPIRKDLIEKYGTDWTKPEKIVTLGPFSLLSYQPQTEIILKRNESYYGPKPFLDKISLQIINEDNKALNLYKQGVLDFTMPISLLEAGSLIRLPDYHTAPHYRTGYLNFNMNEYPLNLVQVRKAIAMSINKSRMDHIVYQTRIPAYSWLPPELFPEGKDAGLPFDPKAAKKLLNEVGFDPVEAKPLELITFSTDEHALITQYIQDQLKKNLGLSVDIKMTDIKNFRALLDLKAGSIFYQGWGADYPDPDSFFGVFLMYSGNNKMGWQNEKYDELVKKATTLPNGPERVKTYQEALDILLRKEAAILPLHYNVFAYLLNPKVKNFVINPLNYLYLRNVRVGD